jgi:hypothetical protein
MQERIHGMNLSFSLALSLARSPTPLAQARIERGRFSVCEIRSIAAVDIPLCAIGQADSGSTISGAEIDR